MSDGERKLWEHDWAIKGLSDSLIRTDANVEDVKRSVRQIYADREKDREEREKDRIALAKFISTAEAAAQAAKDAAEKSVTSKQFYLGVGTAAIAIIGVLLGIKP